MDIYLTIEELATAVGLSAVRIERLVRVGLLDATEPGPRLFTAATAARLRRMLRLHRDLRVNLDGAAIIVDLVEQLEALERELSHRRGAA